MLQFRITIIVLFAVFSLTSCRHKEAQVQGRMQLTVSIIPQKYLANFISGGKFDIQVMQPAGANHETYEPAPRDMEKISTSRLYLALGGLDFENTWLGRFRNSNPDLQVINTSEGIAMMSGHHHDENETSQAHASYDPHTWLSVSCMKIQANNICKALSATDTADAPYFGSKLLKFNTLADSVDHIIRKKLACCPGKSVLIFHPALAYFARDYGLVQISIEQDGKEPSAAFMAELVKTAKARGIKAIFISKEFDTRNAEAIAKEIGGKVVVFDPMAENWPENMIHLADLIASN